MSFEACENGALAVSSLRDCHMSQRTGLIAARPGYRGAMRASFTPLLTAALALIACGSEPGGSTDTDPVNPEPGTTTAGTSDPVLTTDETPVTTDAPTPTTSASTTDAPTTDATSTTDPVDPVDPTDTTTGGPVECGEVTHFATGKAPTVEIHVSPGGSDQQGCGAEAMPCASINTALSKAAPGTAIRLHPGNYPPNQYISNLAGTADAPIWIGGVPGEAKPVFSGGAEGLHLTRVRHLVLHDVEVVGSSANGINVDDGGDVDDPDATRFVVFERLYVHDIGGGGNQDGLKLSGVYDYWVLDSEFGACGDVGSGIDHVGCHRGVIVGNYFHDNGSNAIQCKGGSADIEIRGNLMVESGQRAIHLGGSTSFQYFRPPLDPNGVNAEARDIRAIANVIVGAQTPLAFVGCVDCLAANNTILYPTRWLFRILQETLSTPEYEFAPSSNNRFINNVVVFDRSKISTYVNIGGNTAPETFTFANNLWYASNNPSQSSPASDLPVPETDAIVGQDPGFVDLAGGDYHLTAGSPAVGSGAPLPELTFDHEGRCWADPPSRGAYELE